MDTLGKEMLVFDGATGTMLQALGLPAGHCPDAWCLERPELVALVHRRYVEAGAQIVETNTFGATPVRLARYGLQERVRDTTVAAVRIARDAVDGRALVAGSMGPLGVLVDPLGDFSFDAAYKEFAVQAAAFGEARPDFIIIETIGDLNEMRAAILACKDHAPGIRVIAQMTMGADGRTFTGTDPETAGLVLQSLGADIIGFNCSVGPETLVSAVERIHRVARVPVSVQPNAGMPVLQPDGKTAFPMGPEEFASYAPRLVEAGASIIGGCCGTTPEHIRCLRRAVEGLRPDRESGPFGRAFGLASRTGSLFIDPGRPATLSVGRRIDPSRDDRIAADMRDGAFSLVRKVAREQVAAGAQVIEVSGVPGPDETATMEKAVRVLQRAVRVPLCIRSSSPAALEVGLKAVVGKALVGPFTVDERTSGPVLRVAARYGAAVIGLTVDEQGRPVAAGRLLETARRLVDMAGSYSIPPWDVVIEPAAGVERLSQACSTDSGEEDLKMAGVIRRELGCLTYSGASAETGMATIC